MFSAADDVDEVEPAAAPTNDGQIDAKQIHANVRPEASDVLPGIAMDTEATNYDNSETEPSNHNDIDGTQAHANVQLEKLPDPHTIEMYTCPCQCEDDAMMGGGGGGVITSNQPPPGQLEGHEAPSWGWPPLGRVCLGH